MAVVNSERFISLLLAIALVKWKQDGFVLMDLVTDIILKSNGIKLDF